MEAARQGRLPPALLLHGPDPQLLDDALAAATAALGPDAAGFDREVLDGREVDLEAATLAALVVPVLASRRLVAVRHAQALPARGAEPLRRYLGTPDAPGCLLLLADEFLGAGRDRRAPHWLLEVLPPAAVVAVGQRRGRSLEDWLQERARADGLEVSGEAARLLTQLVGEDTATLLGEVRKAALAGGPDNRTVGAAEVRAVVGEQRLSAIFDLAGAVERGDVGPALRSLDQLLTVEEPLRILPWLGRVARMAWTIGQWTEAGQSVERIARQLNRPAAVVEALRSWVTGQPPGASVRRLERCWEVEWRLKSGGDGRAELTALVVELCRRS